MIALKHWPTDFQRGPKAWVLFRSPRCYVHLATALRHPLRTLRFFVRVSA